ncbi:MAG: hypothetical protein QM715_16565 [Nibricoccus sp.]
MPDEVPPPENPGETFLLAPSSTAAAGKTLPGLQEALVAAQVLKLIKALPPKTPGVAEIKAGAIKLAHAAGEKLSKAK